MEEKRSVSWQDLRKLYGMSQRVLRRKLKPIQKKIDDCVGSKNYRVLTGKQVGIIKKWMESE